VAAVCCVLLGGCWFESSPVLRLGAVEVESVTSDGVAVGVFVEANNRNEIALPLREVRYSVSLDGRTVFTGVRSPEAVLGANSTQTLRLPVAVDWDRLPEGSGPMRLRVSGDLLYVTPGRLAETFFDTGVRRPKAGFVLDGVVERPSPPVEG